MTTIQSGFSANVTQRRAVLAVVAAAVLAACSLRATAGTIDYDNLDWSVQYLIDQSQTVLGVDQFVKPRDNRGLAISPDGRYLYAGYNNPSGFYEVRKIDLTQADYTDATVAHLVNVSRGKALAVDDQGRVYMADGNAIKVYDANLTTLQHTITVAGTCEGVSVVREGNTLVLYASDRTTNDVTKRVLTEGGGAITGATLDVGFNLTGSLHLGSSLDLRGVEVDPTTGKVWVASLSGNTVYVVSSIGSLEQTLSINHPIDIAFDGDTALITRSGTSFIGLFDTTTYSAAGADLSVPLAALFMDTQGGVAGIVTIAGAFYVSGEGVNTAGERSTYGRTDAQSGLFLGDFYTDLTHDDNDPIFFAKNIVAAIPSPAAASVGAIGMAIMGSLASRWRRRIEQTA